MSTTLEKWLRDYEWGSLSEALLAVAEQSRHCTTEAGGRIPTWPLKEAADRLASLSAELDALKAKLAGVDEKGVEVAEAAGLAAFCKSGTQRDALRAAIAAYLAAVGQKP